MEFTQCKWYHGVVYWQYCIQRYLNCIRMTWGVYRNYGFWASLLLHHLPSLSFT